MDGVSWQGVDGVWLLFICVEFIVIIMFVSIGFIMSTPSYVSQTIMFPFPDVECLHAGKMPIHISCS